ncbi:MAG: hypothetical protein LBN08_02950 [Lactobacillales bacterium]|jgi:hypothetical protein|nr:hypothetical protein [Lactobacillales bacterium]
MTETQDIDRKLEVEARLLLNEEFRRKQLLRAERVERKAASVRARQSTKEKLLQNKVNAIVAADPELKGFTPDPNFEVRGTTPATPEKKLQTILTAALVVVVLAILVIGFKLYPFSMKLNGDWSASIEGAPVSLSVKGGEFTFSQANYQNQAPFTIRYTGKLKADGVNHFTGKDIKVYMLVDKKQLTAAEVQNLKENQGDYYKVKNDALYLMTIEFSDAMVKQMYPTKSINQSFGFDLKYDVLQLFGSKVIALNNSRMSKDLIEFTK